MIWPEWAGDVPTWITTIAIAFSAGQFLAERKKRSAEQEREAKAQATRLTAWAVSDRATMTFGIVLVNSSGSTFHDVAVRSVIHNAEPGPIRLLVLPPGRYFVQFVGGKEGWEFPVEIDEYGGFLRPYMSTSKYKVLGITFTDNLEQRWATDEHAALSRR